MKTLIIEDDDDLAFLISMGVEDAGQTAITASSKPSLQNVLNDLSSEALKINTVLLDLNIPGLPPGEAIKMIRGNQKTESSKIFLVSGDDQIERLAKDLEVDGYIKKPFDFTKLSSILNH